MVPQVIRLSALALLMGTFISCSSMYYDTLEKVGIHKRELLTSRVKAAKESQQQAKEEFRNALERFQDVVVVPESDLQATYDRLKDVYERSEAHARNVNERIDSVEDVAAALFEEWEEELSQYQNSTLRSESRRQLQDTQRRYEQMIAAMHRAESKIPPVLAVFRDQVLFLKHNLNARAISAIEGEVRQVEADVQVLLEEMERSISEADSFISKMS